VTFPEDRLKAGMKERIVATVVASHEKCEAEVEKRVKFEEKIQRPFFHVKPLDLKQLKNWDDYLDFEMEAGNHERIVVLFERCLIPAAMYEQFWSKYAR
jgi:pre-mRNA-processing factor 39